MDTVTSKEAMSLMQGLSFTAIGPFLVADLTGKEDLYKGIEVGEHGMEIVGLGKKTDPHSHDFPSFYKSQGLNIECGDKKYTLPKHAVTLVLPGVEHSWIPAGNAGEVGSIDTRHEKQVIADAA